MAYFHFLDFRFIDLIFMMHLQEIFLSFAGLLKKEFFYVKYLKCLMKPGEIIILIRCRHFCEANYNKAKHIFHLSMSFFVINTHDSYCFA